jgi:hypothetical protein
MEIKIKMPDELKSYIVDDWEQICKHKATNNSVYSPHNLAEMQGRIRTGSAKKCCRSASSFN